MWDKKFKATVDEDLDFKHKFWLCLEITLKLNLYKNLLQPRNRYNKIIVTELSLAISGFWYPSVVWSLFLTCYNSNFHI